MSALAKSWAWFNGHMILWRGEEKIGVCGVVTPGEGYFPDPWVCECCGTPLVDRKRIALRREGEGTYFRCVPCDETAAPTPATKES